MKGVDHYHVVLVISLKDWLACSRKDVKQEKMCWRNCGGTIHGSVAKGS